MGLLHLLSKPATSLTPVDVDLIWKQNETWHSEWKQKLDDMTGKVARSAASFANCEGGFVLIGVDKKGNVVGTTESSEAIYQHVASLTSPVPFIEVVPATLQSKPIMLVRVLRSFERVLYLHENTYPIRFGNTTRNLDPREVADQQHRKKKDGMEVLPAVEFAFSRAQSLLTSQNASILVSFRLPNGVSVPLPYIEDLKVLEGVFAKWFDASQPKIVSHSKSGTPTILLCDAAKPQEGGCALNGLHLLSVSAVVGPGDTIIADALAMALARAFGFFSSVLRSFEVSQAATRLSVFLAPHPVVPIRNLTFTAPATKTIPVVKAFSVFHEDASVFGGIDSCSWLLHELFTTVSMHWCEILPLRGAVIATIDKALKTLNPALWNA